MGRTQLSVDILAGLKERIDACKANKKQLLNYVQEIKNKCINQEISYDEYESLLNKKTEGKTIQEWLDYYNSYIANCKKKITTKKRKSKTRKILTLSISLFIVSIIIIASIFYLRPVIIGLVIEETQTYTEKLNLKFTESTNYEWQLENLGQLKSVKISGSIEEKENAVIKIYLDDLLILDSSNIQGTALTGGVIIGLATEETSESESVELYSEETQQTQEEASQEELSPSQEEPLPSSETQESYSETGEEVSQEDLSPSQEPASPSETPTEEPAEEIVEQPILEENITEPEPIEEPEEIILKEFTDICENTCNNLNLNNPSYTLRIEISNAKLKINKLKYEIIPAEIPEEEPTIPEENITEEIPTPENITEPEIPEIPENITEINITEPEPKIPENITSSPILIKQIQDMEIEKNRFIDIHLTDYFLYAESFYLLQAANFTTTTYDHTIRIIPDKDFMGNRTVKIIATNPFGSVESNFFNIIVSEFVTSPSLTKQIPDIQIQKNSYIEINLAEYFSNAESFYFLQTKNISTTIYDHIIKIQLETDFIGTRESKILASNPFGTAESNFFNIIVSEEIPEVPVVPIINITENITITTTQYGAIIGQPVKWKKYIELKEPGIVKIKLPKEAKNIVVNKIIEAEPEQEESQKSYSEEIQEAPKEDLSPSQKEPLSSGTEPAPTSGTEQEEPTQENITEEIPENITEINITTSEENITEPIEKPKEKIKKEKARAKITGITISETGETTEKGFFSWLRNLFGTITGRAVTTEEKQEAIEVTIEDTGIEYEIEYETPAPEAFEKEITKNKKQIIISAPTELNYTDILAYTELPREAPDYKIKLYRTTDGIREQTKFIAKDNNDNGLTDYIEWTVPYLSNQTYELIIEISKAEHLDENKSFISDIYEQVKSLDDLWSETIPSSHYVRVTFRQKLDNTRDITLYPRTVSGNPRIEVYEIDGSEVIAEFTTLNDNKYNKVFLTNLQESQDIFDLKILEGTIELDHIIDPAGGTPSSTLSFFMTDNYATDKNVDMGEFEEAPIQLNDYGNTTEKCEIWNCSTWVTGISTDGSGLYCDGGWDCIARNGVTCGAWNCTHWTETIVDDTIRYCASGWNCTSWDENLCDAWDCSSWLPSSTAQGDSWCDAGWNCSYWNNGVCGNWTCLGQKLTTMTTKYDYYCENGYNCQVWGSGGNCELWNCTGGWAKSAEKADMYCEGAWDCTAWHGDYCESWGCTGWKADSTQKEDMYCGQWSCIDWNAVSKTCAEWDCDNWVSPNDQQNDYYCKTGWNCTTWKSFIGVDIGDLTVHYMFRTAKTTINISITNFDITDHNNTNISLSITGAGSTSGWTVQPGWSQLVNLTADSTKYVIFDVTPPSGATLGSYTANVSENYTGTNATDDFKVYPKATGNSITTLNFFMSSEGYATTDGAISSDEFDECPIVLNDYGNTDFKCNMWDCLGWDTTGTADWASYCAGGWTCTEYNNNVVCLKYECENWAAARDDKRAEYCDDGWNCTNWNGNTCEDWDCLGWASGANEKDDYYCDAVWDCTVWNDNGICETWDCSAPWSTSGDKDDVFCAGVWNCSSWDGQYGQCDNWGCVGTWSILAGAFDAHCTGQWNCSVWNNTLCETWNCTNMLITGDTGDDYYCDTWNCSYWDEIKEVCGTWNCTNWTQGATTEVDYYCDGGWECAFYKEFAPPPDPNYPIFSVYWDDNATLVGSGTGLFNVTVTSTNGTVQLDINGENITATNLTANVYNASYTFSSSGTYAYTWNSWGNGTSANYNVSNEQSYTVNESVADSTPPNVTIVAPDAKNYSTSSIEFNLTVVDDISPQTCLYSLDAGVNNYTMSNTTASAFNATNTSIADGQYTVNFYCNDTSGNLNDSESRGFGIDTTYPLVEIVYPSNNSNHSTQIEINYTVSDTNLQACKWSNDSGATNHSVTCGTNITGQTWDEGSNIVIIWVNDSVNHENSSSVTFTLDTQPPYFEHTIDNFELTEGDAFNYNVNATDGGVGLQAYAVNDTNFEVNSTGWIKNATVLEVALYYINISINDSLNNLNSSVFYVNVTAVANQAPDDPSPEINSTDGTNLTTQDLNCFDTITDPDLGNLLNVTVQWFNNSILHLTLDYNGSYINNTNFSAVLNSANTTAGENWSCGLRLYDGIAYSNWVNSSMNVTILNSAPKITNVYNETIDLSSGPNQGPSLTNITINFTAYDADGAGDLNGSTAKVNITGYITRENATCAKIAVFGTNYANYTCLVQLWWWDSAGTWNITAYIEDNNTNTGQNTTTNFVVGTRTGFEISPGNLTWPGLAPGAVNKTANTYILMNNTGNDNITIGSIQINATNLKGEIDSGKALWAGNFSVAPFTSLPPAPAECNSTATTMNKSIFTNITLASLPPGNYTVNDNSTGQEQLYFCLRLAGTELITQPYSTAQEGTWTIRIMLALLAVKGISKLKKKKKSKKKDKKTIENLTIPSAIFTKKLGCLEAIVKYMKENLGMSYHEIAFILNRNDRTIWTAYKKAAEKQPETISLEKTLMMLPIIKLEKILLVLPVSIFKNKKLTILEAIIVYLKQEGLKYSEIAALLNRDQRNIWTVYSRAVRKIKRKV